VSGYNVIGGAAAVAGVCLVGAALVVAGAAYGIYKVLQGLFALAQAAHGAYQQHRDQRQAELAERMFAMVQVDNRDVEQLMKRSRDLERKVADGGGNLELGQGSLDELVRIQDELTRIEQQGRVRQGVIDAIFLDSPAVCAVTRSATRTAVALPAAEASSRLPYASPTVRPAIHFHQQTADLRGDAPKVISSTPSSHTPTPSGPILGVVVQAAPRAGIPGSMCLEARALLHDRIQASGSIVKETKLRRIEALAYQCSSAADLALIEARIAAAIRDAKVLQSQLDKDRQRAVECLNILDIVDTINDAPSNVTVELRRQLELTLTSRKKIKNKTLMRIDAETTAALRELFDRNIPCVEGAGVIEVRAEYRTENGVITTVTPTSTRRLSRAEHLALDREACQITESLITRFNKLHVEIEVRQEAGVGTAEPASRVALAASDDHAHMSSRGRREDVKPAFRAMKLNPN